MENAKNFNEAEVLVVEDNPNDVEFILRALKKHNFINNVFVVRDGAEALEFIFCTGRYATRDITLPPKVIFLDLGLPKVPGLEVLKKIKADERTKSIPVVVVTSSLEDNDLKESYKLGINSYVVKPVEFENFVRAIGEIGLYWLLLNQPPK
jgi:CheY-like chemotaxis protein